MRQFFGCTLLALILGGCGDSGSDRLLAPDIIQPVVSASSGTTTATDGVQSTGATVTTDKVDYQPGDLVTISGAGWDPGETVSLHISEEPPNHPDHNFTVVADANGAFVHQQLVMDDNHVGVTFTLTATGQTSGHVAQTTFTDGNFNVVSSPVSLFVSITYDRFNGSATCTGSPSSTGQMLSYGVNLGLNSGQSVQFAPPTVPGYTFSGYSPGLLTVVEQGGTLCVSGFPTPPGNPTRTLTLNYEPVNTNQAPTADAGGPYMGDEGSSITLDGSASMDGDGTIASYSWSIVSFDNLDGGTCSFDGGVNTGAMPSVTCNDNGLLEVSLIVTDDDGASSPAVEATVTVHNVDPTATFNAQTPVDEGTAFSLSLTGPDDASSVDVGADFTYEFDCGDGNGYVASASNTASCPTDDNGTRSVKGRITDKDGGSSEYTGTVTVDNVAPTATFNAQTPVDEGTSFTLSLTGEFDPSSVDVEAGLTYEFDCGDGNGYVPSPSNSTTCPTDDNGTRTARGRISDKDGDATEYTAGVTINNVDPSILTFTGIPIAPVGVTAIVNFTGTFGDPGSADTHTLSYECDLGSGAPATTMAVTNSDFAGTCTYANAGIYTIKVTITDDDGGSDDVTSAYIVVYDPSAGFVTGGGWFNSPAGALIADASLTGKAHFGFVSKYKKGANVPDGNTEFQFQAGAIAFHSTSYQWLVVAGSKAQFKGVGKLNGVDGYGFMISAIDGGKYPDKFRIKIWDASGTIYDNLVGSTDDLADPATVLGGGSIVIHAK